MTAKLPETAVAEHLADQAAALSAEQLPAAVRTRAEELLIDVVGLCVAARHTDYVTAVIAGVDAGVVYSLYGALFADGFESGERSAWSASVP